jgi:hypothetical protein
MAEMKERLREQGGSHWISLQEGALEMQETQIFSATLAPSRHLKCETDSVETFWAF